MLNTPVSVKPLRHLICSLSKIFWDPLKLPARICHLLRRINLLCLFFYLLVFLKLFIKVYTPRAEMCTLHIVQSGGFSQREHPLQGVTNTGSEGSMARTADPPPGQTTVPASSAMQ